MNQFSHFLENSFSLQDNNKSCSDDIFNDNIQKYPSLFDNPLSFSQNNFHLNSQYNDQYFQTEQQCLYPQENFLDKSFQFIDQSECNRHQHHSKSNSKDSKQTNKEETDFFKPLSQPQEQSFILNIQDFQQQEAINQEIQEQNESNICQLSEKDDNLSFSVSKKSNNHQSISLNNIDLNSPKNKKSITVCKKKQNQTNSFSPQNTEKSKQSISKNNIRNFLTPIVRMRTNFIDSKLLEKEKVTTKAFESFLKQHFYIPGKNKLKIRQAKFDFLLNSHDKTQIKEKRVFAQTVIRNIQNLFLNLIIEKSATFNTQQFNQQFDWINGINESLVVFLNSTQSQN